MFPSNRWKRKSTAELVRALRRGAVLLTVLLVSACGAKPIRLYGGPERAAAEIAVLSVPEALEIATINGAELAGAHALLRKGDQVLELEPGHYEILAYYREIWQLGDQQDTLHSDPAVFELNATADGRYRLEYVHPGNYDQAKRLTADFSGWVVDLATGMRTPTHVSAFQFRRDLAGAFAPDTLVRKPVGPASESAAPLAPSDPLRALKEEWRRSTPEERQEFLRWATAHP